MLIRKSYRYFKNLSLYGQLDPTEFFFNDTLGVVYVVNAKVACSSLKTAILEKAPSVDDNYSIHRIKGQSYRGKLNPTHQEYFKFSFVRNPVERLYSCYKSKFQNDIVKYSRKTPYFDNYLYGYLKNVKSFEEFVDKVIRISDKYADRHFKSQTSQLVESKNFELDFVGKIETIDQDLNVLKDYGIIDLPHFNSSGVEKSNDFGVVLRNKIIKRYYKDFLNWYPEFL
ncbi:MAG: sulfotransferase family 2 domain-containing protein [Cyclobacteriaceae bacterium]